MYYVQQLIESRSLPLPVNKFFGIYITKMKYLIKRILSTCAWKKTNQNLASDIIFKLFHIYSLLGIINEMVLPETFLFPEREMLEQLKLILGETFVCCAEKL